MSDDQFISVHVLDNRFEADLLMGALRQEGIPAILRTYEETPYDGLFIPQKGWGAILVPESHADEARKIIHQIVEDIQTKRLYENPDEVDPLLWKRLNEIAPEAICSNAQVQYNVADKAYLVPFLNGICRVIPDDQLVELDGDIPFSKIDFELVMVVLHYLLEAQSVPLAGTWIGEKDLPGGELFFRGPHRLPTAGLIDLFGTDAALFQNSMERLGATKAQAGDISYRLWILPRIPLMFILWEGDEDFEPALHIRFDASISEHLQALDSIWALVNVVCRNVRAAAKGPAQKRTKPASI